MRPLAVLATVLTCAAASAAGAQTSIPKSLLPAPLAYTAMTAGQPRADQVATLAILNSAAFAPAAASGGVDPISRLIEREAFQPGAGFVRWSSGQVQLTPAAAGGPVDSLRVSVGGVLRAPAGTPLNLGRAAFDTNAYDVELTRDWPAAIAYDGKRFGLDVTPHAGVGVTSFGGSAEAGATLRLMQRDGAAAERLHALGVKDGASFGERGRWYLFAAASGRAVGLNMLHGETGWDRAGWTTDATSTLIGDAQLGVGWRKGAVQSSFGYIHREVKGQNRLWGLDTKPDSMVAFSFSIRPH